jgi:hypothetical protein
MKVTRNFGGFERKNEKKFLEKMYNKGYVLADHKFITYYFEKVRPKEVVYVFDYQILNDEEEKEYLSLKSDWTFTAKNGAFYWYFKETSDNEKNSEFFNNNESKSVFYLKHIKICIVMAVNMTVIGMAGVLINLNQTFFTVGYISLFMAIYYYYLAVKYYLRSKRVKSNIQE